MAVRSIVMVVIAWMVPVVRVWVTQRKAHAPGQNWLLTTTVCFALFYTSAQDGTADLLALWLGPGTVYAACSLTCLFMLIALLRYQRVYQQATLLPQAHYIPGLQRVHRVLTMFLVFVTCTVCAIEGILLRSWIDERQFTPLAIVLDHRTLVLSRAVFLGAVIVALWGGMIYPYLYLVWHRRSLDPAFREQGGHWRLTCFAGTTLITTVSALVHGSATVLSFVRPQETAMWLSAAHWMSTINGPLLVTGILIGCLPQYTFWSAQAYRLHHRLVPLHTQLQKVVEGVYLDIPKPKRREIILNPLQPIMALRRLHAEIIDARFMCYGEPDGVDGSSLYTDSLTRRDHLTSVAEYEREVLDMIVQGGVCPGEAKNLNVAMYQSLDYYLLLARMIRQDHTNTKPRRVLDRETLYEHARSASG